MNIVGGCGKSDLINVGQSRLFDLISFGSWSSLLLCVAAKTLSTPNQAIANNQTSPDRFSVGDFWDLYNFLGDSAIEIKESDFRECGGERDNLN